MRAGCAIVVLCEKPSGPRTNSEHVKKVSTHELAANAFGLISITDVHLRAAARDHAGEDGISIAQVLVHGERKRAVEGWSILRLIRGQDDELFRVRHRQPLQEHLIEQRKDRGVSANAERE